ncbi:mRNA export factor GLE1-like [Oppia nitens]|uniref:mRNA export factor GLE1-like n=1 Tax=Oppia nitens TaxID=1686743 RepID=UPI0023DCDB2B|nr:mRNA export factor GLE1-like [Oppia nitens]
MNHTIDESNDVLAALKNSSKGRLSYDRNWKEERRTQDIISEVKLKTSAITISPKVSTIASENTKPKSRAKYRVISSPTNEPTNGFNCNLNDDNINNKNEVFINKNSSNKLNESITELDLINYEKQRQELVSQELNKKINNLNTEFNKHKEEFDEELKLIRQKYTLDAIKRINSFADDYKALKDSISNKQMSFEGNSVTASSKLKEIESKQQMLIEEQLRKQTEVRRKQLAIIRSDMLSAITSVEQFCNNLNNVIKNDQYFHLPKQEFNSMNGLLQTIDKLMTKPVLSESDFENAQNLKSNVIRIQKKIVSDIEILKQNINQQKVNQVKPIAEVSAESVIKTNETSSESKTDTMSEFVDIKAFKHYLTLQKQFNDFETSFQTFTNDPRFKQKKNELTLFVKTTINTISCESVDHIRDKLNRLTILFNEKSVEYGGKQISCSQKDGSLNFCISLTTKMFISVSTKQKDISLTMAPIIVLLWSRFPIFGQIFLAHMQDRCPYLVPYYPKRDSAENETNYLIACGFTVAKDGIPESEETFINRMRSLVKLYSAVIQCNIQTNHPHDLKHAWIWVSRLLNLEPRPAITAAVLESFLSITAHKMYRFYGKQFIKLLNFIVSDYLKRIETISPKGTKRQSLVKLQMFCEEFMKKIRRNVNHKDLAPEGLIPDYFFQSTYSFSRGTSFSRQ